MKSSASFSCLCKATVGGGVELILLRFCFSVEAKTRGERQLAEHTVDWLSAVRRSGKAVGASPAPATPAPATPAPGTPAPAPASATPSEPALKKQKIVPASPPPPEPEGEGEESGDEWNLKVDDCVAYLEHFMPAKEVVAAGETMEGFSRVARFYCEHLKSSKRTPKGMLAELFMREIISPKTMQSKAGRAKWFDAWQYARKQEFVQKPRK